MSEPAGPDLSGYSSRRRPGPPIEQEDRDPVDPPPAVRSRSTTATPNRNPDDVQFNVRISREHRQMLDDLLTVHPRRRAKLRDVLEDLIEAEHTKKRKQLETRKSQSDGV